MNRLLIFLILISAHFAQAQVRVRMKAFEDYNKCYIGFINRYNRRDTIYHPQFESIRYWDRLMEQGEHLWIVQKNGKCGLLNNEGKYILDHKYDSILVYSENRDFSEIGQKQLVVYNDGLYGTLDYEGNVVLPIQHKCIEIIGYDRLMLCNEDGKAGIYDLKTGEFIVAPKYDAIELQTRVMLEEYHYGHKHEYYSVELKGRKGIVDLEGNEIVPPEYHHIEMLQQKQFCEESPIWYRVHEDYKVGLFDPQGKQVLEAEHDEVNVYFEPADSCEYKRTSVISRRGEFFQLHNPETGSSSERYPNMYPFGMQSFVIEKRNWVVLGRDGKQRFEGKKSMTPLAHNIYGDSKIIYTKRVKDMPKRMQPYFKYDSWDRMGLFDFELDKKTPLEYYQVEVKKQDDKFYYWMLREQESSDISVLDIYDEQLEQINSVELYGYGIDGLWDNWQYGERVPEEELVVYFKDRSHVGALNFIGEVVIPPVYGRVLPKINPSPKGYYIPVMHMYNFYTDSTLVQYSKEGVQLSPNKYADIYPFTDSLLLASYKGKYDFLNLNYNVVLGGCESYEKPSVSDRKWQKRLNDFRRKRLYYPEDHAAIKDNKYYFLLGNEWYLMDSTELDFSSKKYVLISGNLVNERGEIVYGRKLGQNVAEIAEHFYLISDSVLTVWDLKGEEVWSLDNVTHYRYNRGDQIQVYLGNGTSGSYDLPTQTWIIKPNYLEYRTCIINGWEGLTWVRQREGKTDYWTIIDSTETEVIPLRFDVPFHIHKNEQDVVFTVNGLQGIINKNLEVTLEAKYDFVRRRNYEIYLMKDRKWGFVNKVGEVVEPQFHSIAFKSYSNGRLVFGAGDLVGAIDHNGEWLVPLIPEREMLEKHNLVHILSGKRRNAIQPYFGNGIIFGADSLDAYRRINNENIYLHNSWESTNSTFFPRYKQHALILCKDPINTVQRTHETNIKFFSSNYYSAERESSEMYWNDRRDYPRMNVTQINYQFVDGKEVPLSFDALFKGSSSIEVIDEILMDIFNSRQLFGVACIDKVKAIREAKENFLITKSGILLKEVSYGKDVLLPYWQIKSELIHPEDF